MKLKCKKNKLLRSLSKADRVVSKNSSLPVLSCVILETNKNDLIIKSTNLEIGFKTIVPSKVYSEGRLAISSNLLVSYLANLNQDEELLLELKDSTLFISGNKTETKINTSPVDDFPTIPDTSGKVGCKIPSKELIEGLKSVWYAASVSSIKPELSSVFIYHQDGEILFVATDSFRLAEKKIKTKIEESENILIPQKNVVEIVRDIDIRFDEDKVSFSFDEEIYAVSRVIDGNFPDYKQIIPKESSTQVTVLKNDLINTLKISNLFLNNFNQVNFNINSENNSFEIVSKSSEKGESRNTVPATIEGESLEINFNQKYINDSFNSIKSESLVMEFNGKGKPMIIKSVGDNSFRYLVMPLNK